MHSWPSGIARSDESKHDEVGFQLTAADFGSNSLWQTYLKDNSWMCILHQYHKASGLKACTATCLSEKKYLINPCFSPGGRGGGGSVVKEYEIITLEYNGKACRLYLLFFCAPEDIILKAIRPGSTKFEGKYFSIQTVNIRHIDRSFWKHAYTIPSD